MSIDKLKQRLEQQIEDFSANEKIHIRFVKPQRLIKTLHRLEQRFDELENTIPLDQKIFRTVVKFEHSGSDALSRKDWKNLAWALSKVLPKMDKKLIFSSTGQKIIKHFNKAEIDIISLVYFPLLYSYFALESEDVKDKPEIWLELRKILITNQSEVYKSLKQPKKWMSTLFDHSEILSDFPTQPFIYSFLSDLEDNQVERDLEALKIAHFSWFWDDLIKSSIQSIKNMNENKFFKFIPKFLILAEQNALYATDILSALLEKYATTSERKKIHEKLKSFALNQWGNPQYSSSAGWNNVSVGTKRMVIQWFVRADLEAFFKLFSDTADTNRFDYWIKFINRISFSQIFLGPNAIQSQHFQHRQFKELNRGRFKYLIGSTASNNAFLLKIDNIYVVDFSDTGNACYAYNKLPYRDITPKVDVRDLKNKSTVLFKNNWGEPASLSHSGDWKSRFDEKLAELGIFAF